MKELAPTFITVLGERIKRSSDWDEKSRLMIIRDAANHVPTTSLDDVIRETVRRVTRDAPR